MGFFSSVSNFFFDCGILPWDVLLTLLNLVRRKRRIGHVTPEGHPGYGGHWPEFRPPQEGDSRCSCPALNAMANHGILPRSGRDISFVELNHHIRATYNFGPSFCSFVPHYAARMLKRNYNMDTFNLADLDLHNGIEHDASLFRLDTALEPDQSAKHIPFIEELLESATGKDEKGNDILTTKDLSRILGKRRAVARATNSEFSLSFFHKVFGSSNSSTLLTIFGGRVDDLRSIVLHERIPEGWESRIRQPYGLTMTNFNKTVLTVELGVREKDWEEVAQDAARSRVTPV
ncbi:Chloroperoxidase [Suillus clintonianus]|uniref:Chloroperoxidase n=1 Tax=Suillus clintonianus TaxID=1904413 RepID=UPI001B86008B|nr:Chloroperoxidase [Suillus clintonianus]KAG2134793.1 Chloroperoxidase [Suillus clintonianus]